MTYYDKLDLILKYFHDRKTTAFESREEAWGNLKTHFTFDEFKMLLEHLCDKWFIMSDSVECRNNQFKISLKGIEFFEDGGFKYKKRTIILNKTWTVLKVISAIISSLAIISLTYLQWRSMDKVDINYIQHETDIKILYDAFVNVQMDRDSLEKRLHKLENK